MPTDVDHYDYYYSHLVLATMLQLGLGSEEDPSVIIAAKSMNHNNFLPYKTNGSLIIDTLNFGYFRSVE